MSAVVRLPTAAPRYVAQPRLKIRRNAVSAAIEAGGVVSFPGEFIPHWEREREAAGETGRTIMEAGGMTRSGTFLLASAILGAMTPGQQASVAAFLGLFPSDDPAAIAALHWAEQVTRSSAAMRAFAEGGDQ